MRYGRRPKAIWTRFLPTFAVDNPKAALKLYEAFFRQFEFLAIFPESGSLRKEFTPLVRSLAIGNYLIFFTEKSPVEIVRVLHGTRDYPSDIEEL